MLRRSRKEQYYRQTEKDERLYLHLQLMDARDTIKEQIAVLTDEFSKREKSFLHVSLVLLCHMETGTLPTPRLDLTFSLHEKAGAVVVVRSY